MDAFPFAGMTRIRFGGSSAAAELSAVYHGSPNVVVTMPQLAPKAKWAVYRS